MGNCFQETLMSILKCLGIESSSSTSSYLTVYAADLGGATTSGNDQPPPADDQTYNTGGYDDESVSALDDQPTDSQEIESEEKGRNQPRTGVTTGSPQTNADEL